MVEIILISNIDASELKIVLYYLNLLLEMKLEYSICFDFSQSQYAKISFIPNILKRCFLSSIIAEK